MYKMKKSVFPNQSVAKVITIVVGLKNNFRIYLNCSKSGFFVISPFAFKKPKNLWIFYSI